ncbi:MAG: hypothetical protein RLZZ587_259 [Actinomycetota bacterium]|jgi:8-oxo-dGTP pyrophosphatase MutT (NUDIX family)
MIHPDGREHVTHRETARIVLQDRDGRFLLLLTHFDAGVGLPPRWITPGGGIDEGETVLAAAVRELREETGMVVEPEALGGVVAELPGWWDWSDGERFHSYVDHFFALTVDRFELDTSGWTESERHDVLDIRWWSLDEIDAEQPFLGPEGLKAVLSSVSQP